MSNVFPPGVQLAERYRVVRLLQSGAASALYEVEQLVSHERAVLKWLRWHGTGSIDSVQAVASAAKAASALRHGHVAKVHEVVREGGSLFVVSELLTGDPLQALLSPHLLPRRERLRLVCEAMLGAAAAHAAGVVHRGIHPDNIFVSRLAAPAAIPGSTSGSAKLLDFATSKHALGPALATLAPRASGSTLGHHVYLAPEQLRPADPVDQRADVYALGVIAYQALTGRLPYIAEDVIELAVRIATTVPARAAVLCPEIPASLDRALEAALARDANARMASVEPLLAELDAFARSGGAQPAARWHAGGATALVVAKRAPQRDYRGAETSLVIARPAPVPPVVSAPAVTAPAVSAAALPPASALFAEAPLRVIPGAADSGAAGLGAADSGAAGAGGSAQLEQSRRAIAHEPPSASRLAHQPAFTTASAPMAPLASVTIAPELRAPASAAAAPVVESSADAERRDAEVRDAQLERSDQRPTHVLPGRALGALLRRRVVRVSVIGALALAFALVGGLFLYRQPSHASLPPPLPSMQLPVELASTSVLPEQGSPSVLPEQGSPSVLPEQGSPSVLREQAGTPAHPLAPTDDTRAEPAATDSVQGRSPARARPARSHRRRQIEKRLDIPQHESEGLDPAQLYRAGRPPRRDEF